MKYLVVEAHPWNLLPGKADNSKTYVWDYLDWFAVFVSIISLSFLIYLSQVDNDIVRCGPEVDNTNSFVGIQVSVLNRHCEEDAGLFACVIAVAISFQYVRALLGNEVGQERRVILTTAVGPSRTWDMRWSFHWKSVVMSVLGIFGTVLIITQNVWVFVALTVSYEFAMYRYLLHSPADQERATKA